MKPVYDFAESQTPPNVNVTFIDSKGGVHFLSVIDVAVVVYTLETEASPAMCRVLGVVQEDFTGIDAEHFFACWNAAMELASDVLNADYDVWQDDVGNRMLVSDDNIVGASLEASKITLRGVSADVHLSPARAEKIMELFARKGFVMPSLILP